ncbi:hypothetical protein HK103_005572 [Boothiomyces macroporosus]|uniref:NAD(P)-binding domain-containing protein n=1 Tax=Boothiomyces macroporosus TaxID=261099 RepID=A0AAD5UF06_9FUNG|nr:hypothetical protein HK103_005572 [Boothiomyces macroporosus]
MEPKIVVIPAGSNSGLACVNSLAALDIPVRCCVRTPKDLPSKYILTNINAMNRDDLKRAFHSMKSALIVTPHDHKEGFENDSFMTCQMIKEAVDQGVEYIVLVGSWTVHQPEIISEIANRFVEAEALLKQFEKEKGLKWTVLRGGYFISNLLMYRDLINNGGTVKIPNYVLSPVHTRDIGECAAICLVDGPEKHHGKHYEMNGPKQQNITEIFEILQKEWKPFKYEIIPASELQAPSYIKQFAGFLEKEGAKGTPYTRDVGNLIGDRWTSVEQWAKEVKHLFQ